jgi:hypothetical protein
LRYIGHGIICVFPTAIALGTYAAIGDITPRIVFFGHLDIIKSPVDLSQIITLAIRTSEMFFVLDRYHFSKLFPAIFTDKSIYRHLLLASLSKTE